jgi:hypothetical protein
LTVTVTCPELSGRSIKARLADLSVHGLSLILSRELPLGSRVKVEWGQTNFVGELVYCETYGREYLAGLKVDDPVYATLRNPSQ